MFCSRLSLKCANTLCFCCCQYKTIMKKEFINNKMEANISLLKHTEKIDQILLA